MTSFVKECSLGSLDFNLFIEKVFDLKNEILRDDMKRVYNKNEVVFKANWIGYLKINVKDF